MADVIVVGIVLVFVCAAIWYLWKEKRKGTRCVGCPSSGCCSGCCSGEKSANPEENGKFHTD